MKILNFNNTDKHQPKIKKIKKYGTNKNFWFDFENNRKTTKDDYRYFLRKIYPQAHYIFNGHQGVKRNLLFFHVYWQLPFYLIGKNISPRENIMHIVNETVLNIFQKKDIEKKYTDIADIIYHSFFTPVRIENFKKLKIVVRNI